MSLVIKQTRVVEVPVTTLNVCQSIMAMTTMLDADGAVCGHAIFPTWIPQVLEIDLATGQIKNWQVPTGEQLQHIADAYADGQKAKQVTTPEPPQAVESAADTVANAADCAPAEPPYTILDLMKKHSPDVAESVMQGNSNVPDAEPVVTVEPNPMLTPNNIKDGYLVLVSESDDKWSATCKTESATSRESVFAAINGCAKKIGLGICEINQIKDKEGNKVEGCYLINDARTKDRLSVYVGGYEVGKGYTARTGKGHKYTAENPELALDGLISHALKVTLPPNAIVQTTDDATVFNDKQRYSIDMTKAVAIVEPSTPEPDWADGRRDQANDIEDAPQPICQPARARYRNPDDHDQTWTGRGKPPEWLQAKLDAGDQLTDYAISDSAA